MLNCIYHPVDGMQVVDNADRERHLKTGFWFDTPQEAAEKRRTVEKDMKKQKSANTDRGKKT